MTGEAMKGGCACGAVRFEAEVEMTRPICAIAGCASVRPASVSIAFKNSKQADVAGDGGPDWYESSPIARRPYCARVRHVARLPVQEGPKRWT